MGEQIIETGTSTEPTEANGDEVNAPAATPSVREWARANGHEVADLGRISQKIKDAYNEAHPDA